MSEPADRRLHPLSLLFHLGASIKDFFIPLVVALFASRSDTWQTVVPTIIGGLASGAALLKYFSYTYRYGEEDLVVRTGMIFRNERHIPYDRIENIDAVQNVVHRFFDVAVIQVQTGSSSEPEATLSVLPMNAVAEMRRRVITERRAGTVPIADERDAVSEAAATPAAPRVEQRTLLHLPPRELLLVGLVENRGLALVVAATGLLPQVGAVERLLDAIFPEKPPAWFENSVRSGTMPDELGWLFVAIGGFFLILFAGIRLLSTLWAVMRLYDFTLLRDGDDLRISYGSFTRVTATIPLRRIQTISIHQRLLHRVLRRAAIRVTTAGASGIPGTDDDDPVDREWLAPIIPTHDVSRLLHELDPDLKVEGIRWTPAHPRAAGRMIRVSLVWAIALSAPLVPILGWRAAAVVATILGARAVLRGRGIARSIGCALVGERVAFKRGWLHRIVSVARFERVQCALFTQSPFDRRRGMARIAVDTAGMGESRLSMPYLPAPTALELHAQLSEAAARTRFSW